MSAERLQLERIQGNPASLPEQELGKLAILYASVFAGEPWNEYTVCSKDNTFFGLDTEPGGDCPQTDCQGTLSFAYPADETATYITGELLRSDAALWLLRDSEDQDRMVGFSWGFSYPDTVAFAEGKYKTPAMRVAIDGLLRRRGIGANGLWYLSESGILDDTQYRGQGWSRIFHERRLEVARSFRLDAVQRTASQGNMYRTSRRTMTQVMGPAMRVEDGTRRLQPTGNVVNGLMDSENPARVLFARSREP